jgi:predicted PhzF superfamily epimerase YddE/YHI9
VRDRAAPAALRPDLASIVEWGTANGVSGCYVYCRLEDGEYAGRNFNHLDPALEDSASGVAAGALSVLRQRGLTLYQGEATGQPCMVRTRFEDGQVLVGGAAEAVPG